MKKILLAFVALSVFALTSCEDFIGRVVDNIDGSTELVFAGNDSVALSSCVMGLSETTGGTIIVAADIDLMNLQNETPTAPYFCILFNGTTTGSYPLTTMTVGMLADSNLTTDDLLNTLRSSDVLVYIDSADDGGLEFFVSDGGDLEITAYPQSADGGQVRGHFTNVSMLRVNEATLAALPTRVMNWVDQMVNDSADIWVEEMRDDLVDRFQNEYEDTLKARTRDTLMGMIENNDTAQFRLHDFFTDNPTVDPNNMTEDDYTTLLEDYTTQAFQDSLEEWLRDWLMVQVRPIIEQEVRTRIEDRLNDKHINEFFLPEEMTTVSGTFGALRLNDNIEELLDL